MPQVTLDVSDHVWQLLVRWAKRRGQDINALLAQSLEAAAKAAAVAERPTGEEPWQRAPFWGEGDRAVIAWQRDRAGFERLASVRQLLDDTPTNTPLWWQLVQERERLEQQLGLAVTSREVS